MDCDGCVWMDMHLLRFSHFIPRPQHPFPHKYPTRPHPNGYPKNYQGKDCQYDCLPRVLNPMLTLFPAKTPSKETKAKNAKKAALVGAHSTTKRKVRTTVSFHRPKTLRLSRSPKYPRKSIPHTPRMDQYRVIVSYVSFLNLAQRPPSLFYSPPRPLNTESAMKKIEENNTLVFITDLKANKRQIKDAVKKLYDVQAAKVNTLIRYVALSLFHCCSPDASLALMEPRRPMCD